MTKPPDCCGGEPPAPVPDTRPEATILLDDLTRGVDRPLQVQIGSAVIQRHGKEQIDAACTSLDLTWSAIVDEPHDGWGHRIVVDDQVFTTLGT